MYIYDTFILEDLEDEMDDMGEELDLIEQEFAAMINQAAPTMAELENNDDQGQK